MKYANIHRVHEIKQTVHFILTICQQHFFQFNLKKKEKGLLQLTLKQISENFFSNKVQQSATTHNIDFLPYPEIGTKFTSAVI